MAAFVIGILTVIVSAVFMFIENGRDGRNENDGQTGELWGDETDEPEKNAWMSVPDGSVKNAWANEPDRQVGMAYDKNVFQNAGKILPEGKTMLKHVYESKSKTQKTAGANAPV